MQEQKKEKRKDGSQGSWRSSRFFPLHHNAIFLDAPAPFGERTLSIFRAVVLGLVSQKVDQWATNELDGH